MGNGCHKRGVPESPVHGVPFGCVAHRVFKPGFIPPMTKLHWSNGFKVMVSVRSASLDFAVTFPVERFAFISVRPNPVARTGVPNAGRTLARSTGCFDDLASRCTRATSYRPFFPPATKNGCFSTLTTLRTSPYFPSFFASDGIRWSFGTESNWNERAACLTFFSNMMFFDA